MTDVGVCGRPSSWSLRLCGLAPSLLSSGWPIVVHSTPTVYVRQGTPNFYDFFDTKN